jgi:hypothetical protein
MNPRDPKYTREYVMDRLSYDPDTGEFRWRTAGNNRTKVGSVAGHVGPEGYLRISLDGKRIMAHRLAWLIYHGEWPGSFIDHVDENKLNNRISNLRQATKSQNTMNIARRSDNSTGHRGIYYSNNPNRVKKYIAQIAVDGRQKTIGYFMTLEEAIAARKAAVAVLHGRFGKT